MKKLKSWKSVVVLILAVIGFSFSIFLAHPSNAASSASDRYRGLLELGLIDGIRTPQERGLDYLQQEPVQLAEDAGLMSSIRTAINRAGYLPENTPLKFRVGTNRPIRIGQTSPNDNGTQARRPNNDRAIGYVTSNGQPKPLTRRDLVSPSGMFPVELRNGGQIRATSQVPQILVADARGSFFQAQRQPLIDLIVEDPTDGNIYLLPSVYVNAFCRDALNAVLNDEVELNNYDVESIRPDEVTPPSEVW